MTELVLTPERVIRERIDTDVPCNRIRIFSLEGNCSSAHRRSWRNISILSRTWLKRHARDRVAAETGTQS